ncbi:Protein-L-isoaspartate O-methyltransferase [Paraburkholderia hiiakae]|uniref:Protein-L-isoaspartate O-methyltransferase n=1 Tax=Paraburkholderia hiiakae TaxID=1081782 RepID=A0ABN7HWN9_9BURK|nr:protein-L-isoaspartate(D-aspartate) O-methyltransferase [Paraburkholderia hiiakae]CAD6537245.1 Protein-L-isoaspartate O-methyltransferase [Paraburkholderia hiiakae]
MTGERTKRFPLGLADLVREPRRRDTRPGDARTPLAGNSSASKPGVGALAKPGAKAGTPAVAKSIASTPFKAPPAKPVNAKPMGAKPASSIKPAPPGGSAAAPRAAIPGGASAPRPATAVTGAPGVALNGAHALTSERVRERMVERLRANGIADARVLQALAAVPRHMFIDPGLATQAYEDAALPIGHHQTISKPSVVARMLELAGAGRVLERVLEIGTGCGYQAAVLSQIARDVYSIERIKPLYERAKTNLRPLRIPNIRLHYGDGRLGLPSAAPFDAIVIAAAGFDVPPALLEQLAIGGRLVAPVAVPGTQGAAGEATQVLTLVERTGPAQWRESRLDRVFFVPLKSGVI